MTLLAAVEVQATPKEILSHGLAMPPGSIEVGENRYRADSTYEETLKFFKTLTRKPIVNQPGIKAVHFDSDNPKSGWEGINVYQKGGDEGEVRIFVIPRETTEKKKDGGKTKSSTK
jgi:hypothetical protein